MSQRMLDRYYLLPTIGRLSLCTVVWHIYVTRLFGVIFRLFQSCPYDYQTNGARVRATGIVGILTGENRALPMVLYCSHIMYQYYSRLGFPQIKQIEEGKYIQNEIFNNIPNFIKNRLHVECIQDSFVMYNDKVILRKK